jgi:hypothetical protein
VIVGPEPAGPFEVHAFDRDKLLLDPYARCIAFPPGFDRAAALGGGPNLGKAPLGMIEACERPFEWGRDRRPRHEADALIYELHVRGFTQHGSSGVSDDARGTFAGVIEKIPYLQELGVTIVELMPVFQFDPQAGDSWGYMPMSFFAPHRPYAPPGHAPIDAFRAMVAALHDARDRGRDRRRVQPHRRGRRGRPGLQLQGDRRAVGRRGRVRARPRVPGDHMAAVEQPVPRRRAPVRARRRRLPTTSSSTARARSGSRRTRSTDARWSCWCASAERRGARAPSGSCCQVTHGESWTRLRNT